MKKFLSALALVAVVLFPFALQAKTVTFTTNIPEATYIQEIPSYNVAYFNGQTSMEVNFGSSVDGIEIRPNSGYDLVSVTIGESVKTPYGTSLYIDLEDIPEGGTVAIEASEKAPRTFTISGNPDEVSLSYSGTIYDSNNIEDGKWTIVDSSDYGSYLDINCASGYVIESVTNDATNASMVSEYQLFSPRASVYLSASEFPQGAAITVKCSSLAAVRTVHVSLTVIDGEADQISVRRNGEYTPIPSSEWDDIALNPQSELPLQISSTDWSKSLYKVEVNGTPVEATYGSFYLNDLADGDKISVWPNFPDVTVPVKFNFVNEGTEGAIYAVYINSEPVEDAVWQAEDFSVKLGDKLGVSYNTNGYQINSVTINGVAAQSLYSYNETVSSEDPLIFVIDAEKYKDYTVKLIYEPGTIVVYNDYGTNNPIELPADAGEVTLNIERGKNYLNIKAAEGYIITSAINLLTDEDLYLPVAITGDMEIAVYTEKFDRDNLCVLYLADSQWNYANVTLSMRNDATRESITPVVGYNFIKYANADRPFSMTFYPDADLYINGEQSVNNYGEWSGAADLEPNSVIKVFPQGTEVATYNVTIDNQSEGSIAILADYVTPLEGTQAGVFGPTDVEFVSVETAAAEGASAFIIKVNDEEIKANAQGKFVAHITADATISIEADQNVGITEITAGANDAIYNLQGVRVKNAKGGIFIRNGRKVVR